MNTVKFPVQWTIEKTSFLDCLPRWFDAFILDRKSQGVSPGTVYFYAAKFKLFDAYCSRNGLARISEVQPLHLRAFLVELEAQGHNPGGIHAVVRTLRAFFSWYIKEEDPNGFQNPMRNIKPPRLPDCPLKPIEVRTVEKLLSVCEGGFCGVRDRAIILFLLDSGLRASELISLNTEDVDIIQGDVRVRNGKGNKSRTVAIGRKTRRAMRAYVKLHSGDSEALWLTDDGERLTYWGLNQIISRLAKRAGIPKPELHDFRRAFALNCLRNGMDVYSLQRLMGHSDLQVMRRYLDQTDEDIRAAHAKASPVDNARL